MFRQRSRRCNVGLGRILGHLPGHVLDTFIAVSEVDDTLVNVFLPNTARNGRASAKVKVLSSVTTHRSAILLVLWLFFFLPSFVHLDKVEQLSTSTLWEFPSTDLTRDDSLTTMDGFDFSEWIHCEDDVEPEQGHVVSERSSRSPDQMLNRPNKDTQLLSTFQSPPHDSTTPPQLAQHCLHPDVRGQQVLLQTGGLVFGTNAGDYIKDTQGDISWHGTPDCVAAPPSAAKDFWNQEATIFSPVRAAFIRGTHSTLVTDPEFTGEVVRRHQGYPAHQLAEVEGVPHSLPGTMTQSNSSLLASCPDGTGFWNAQPNDDSHAAAISGEPAGPEAPVCVDPKVLMLSTRSPELLATIPRQLHVLFQCAICGGDQRVNGKNDGVHCTKHFNKINNAKRDEQQRPKQSLPDSTPAAVLISPTEPTVTGTDPCVAEVNAITRSVQEQSLSDTARKAVLVSSEATPVTVKDSEPVVDPESVPQGFDGQFKSAQEARNYINNSENTARELFVIADDDWSSVDMDEFKAFCSRLFDAIQQPPAPAPTDFSVDQKMYHEYNQANSYKQCRALLQTPDMITLASARVMDAMDEVMKLHKNGAATTAQKADGQLSRGYDLDKGLKCRGRLLKVIEVTGMSKYIALDVLRGKNIIDLVRNPSQYHHRKLVNACTNAKRSRNLKYITRLAKGEDLRPLFQDHGASGSPTATSTLEGCGGNGEPSPGQQGSSVGQSEKESHPASGALHPTPKPRSSEPLEAPRAMRKRGSDQRDESDGDNDSHLSKKARICAE